MRYAKALLLTWGLVLLFGLGVAVPEAQAQYYADARGTKQVHTAVERLEAQLREARHVERATRHYSTHDYSDFAGRSFTAQQKRDIGRWVWLARETGWQWSQIDMLMHIIARESSGQPSAKNPDSTATGLLQFLAFHFDGSGDHGWKFDPRNPRSALRFGYKLYLLTGWSPWAV